MRGPSREGSGEWEPLHLFTGGGNCFMLLLRAWMGCPADVPLLLGKHWESSVWKQRRATDLFFNHRRHFSNLFVGRCELLIN